ncbi:MAG: ankyrin repeat domain-containing protein [Acidobacteria bacterium]|nr:ankyrin repeat domain-containing protein [Acidobacteriota bacterium]
MRPQANAVVLSGLCFLLGITVDLRGESIADLRVLSAVQKGDKRELRSLLAKRANVNVAAGDGATALAWAVHKEDAEAVDLLIRAGADVNSANDYGITPLALGCVNKNVPIITSLLRAGAAPNAIQKTGETPFMTCVRTGDEAAVRLLLGHGADVSTRDAWAGQTALMWAAAGRHAGVVRMLIERSADVNARSKGNFTPLMFAAQQGDLESAQALLATGAHLNGPPSKDGLTPLLISSAAGHLAVAKLLLEKGADVGAAERRGFTSLHYAAANRGMIELIKPLLAKGLSPNSQVTNDIGRVSDTFRKSEVGQTPFLLAAQAGNTQAMRLLAANGADVNLPTKEGFTPLMIAAGLGIFEPRTETQYRSALEAVRTAIELGANVNAVAGNGWTALHGAAYSGADAIIQHLVEQGARVDVLDQFGQTPLSIASAVVTQESGEFAFIRPHRFYNSTVDLLLKLGATSLEGSGVRRVGSLAVKPGE